MSTISKGMLNGQGCRLIGRGGVLIFAIVLTSCTDLSEVTKFADASQKVGSSFADIATGAEQSCARANEFATPANNVPKLDCAWYSGINPSLTAVNNALFGYIASLGKLASSDTSKVGSGLDNVSDNLKKGDPKISSANLSKASAASGFVKAIAEVWASGYRERNLASIITRNNDAVKNVTEFLSDYAADAYRQTLSHEKEYEVSYCDLMRSPKHEPLATTLLEKTCTNDSAQIDQKLKAIKAYQQALQTVQTTHEKLAKETGVWDINSLSKELGPGIGDLAKAASAINKAF